MTIHIHEVKEDGARKFIYFLDRVLKINDYEVLKDFDDDEYYTFSYGLSKKEAEEVRKFLTENDLFFVED